MATKSELSQGAAAGRNRWVMWTFAVALVFVMILAVAAQVYLDGGGFSAPYAPYTVSTDERPYAPYTAGPVVREVPYAAYTPAEERPYAPYTAGPVVPEEPYAPYDLPR